MLFGKAIILLVGFLGTAILQISNEDFIECWKVVFYCYKETLENLILYFVY